MNKNVLYLLITIIAIVAVMMFATHNDKEPLQTANPAASPVNGLVEKAPAQPGDLQPSAATPAAENPAPADNAAAPAMDSTTPPSASENTTDVDDVPASAEVSGEGNSNNSTTDAGKPAPLPPSEGQ